MATAKKEETKKDKTKKLTLQEKLDAVTFKNKEATDISDLQKENTKLKDMIAAQPKSKRGPSQASRIQGLQVLTNTLGTQKV